jgi:hypothetical protein
MVLSFHRVREAIAAKSIAFFHVDEVRNSADILSKHWDYQQVWKLIRPTQLDDYDTFKDYSHSGTIERGSSHFQSQPGRLQQRFALQAFLYVGAYWKC